MTSRIKLNIPTYFARWATNAGRVLEPDETGTTLSNKDLGWLLGDEPPARWMNWLQNNFYEWSKINASIPVSNYFQGADVGSNTKQLIYDAVNEFFVAINQTGSQRSIDCLSWESTVAISLTGNPSLGTASFNSTHILIPATLGYLIYSTDATSWSESYVGVAQTIKSIDTNYPDTDLTIIGGDNQLLLFSTTGIGGTWTAPTVGPTLTASTTIIEIIHQITSTWYGASTDGEVFKTVDNGVNWANLANEPTININSMDINPNTGTIVSVGESSNTATIQYTKDDGVTSWQTATLEEQKLTNKTNDEFTNVRHIGSDIWVATGKINTGTGQKPFYVYTSIDDGVTWKWALSHDNVGAGGLSFINIALNNKFLALGTSTQEVFLSHSIT